MRVAGGRRAPHAVSTARARRAVRSGESFGIVCMTVCSRSLLLRSAVAAPVRAQLTIEIVGGAGHDDPHRDRPVRRRVAVGRWASPASSAPTSRAAGLFRLVDAAGVVAAAGARRGRARRRLARPRRRRRRRRLDAAAGRRPRRGPLRAGRRRSSRRTLAAMTLHGHAGAVPRHRAQDRRRHLREADRRPRRVLDAHRLHHQAGAALPAARRRRRRRQPAGDRHVERAAAVAALVARRHAHRLRVVREQEAGRLRAVAGHRAARRCSPTSAAATARRRGRRTAASSSSR